jgi:thioredoxin 1
MSVNPVVPCSPASGHDGTWTTCLSLPRLPWPSFQTVTIRMPQVVVSIFAAQHWRGSKFPAPTSSFVHEFEDSLFKREIVNAPAGKIWVVDFFATWCGPCKQFAPEFDATADKLGSKVSFARINVDIATDTAQRYQIRSIPTVMMFRNGKPVAETGGMDRENLGLWITSNL